MCILFLCIGFFLVSDSARDELCLVLLVESLEHDDLLSLWIRGEERLFHLVGIIFYDGIRRLDDDLGRTIVLFEIDDERIRIVFFKVQNIRNIRPAPAINPLPVISYDTEIATFTCEDADNLVLERVGILVLIDHKVLESSMKVLAHFFVLEHRTKEEEEVIEVESIFFAHLADIGLIDLEHDRTKVAIHARRVLYRSSSLPFCTRYHPLDAARIELFLIDVLRLHDFFYRTETVVSIIYDEVFPISESVDKHP